MIKALIIALLLCAALFFLKNNYSHVLYKKASTGLEPLVNSGKVEHLFLGSSMFKQGIDANAIAELTGKETYLLSYNGNQPVMELEILRYLIQHRVEIEHLYVDLYLFSAENPFFISDSRIFLDTDLAFKLRLLSLYDNPTLNTYYEALVSANNELLVTYPFTYSLINSRTCRGSTLVVKNGISPEEMAQQALPETQGKLCEAQIFAIREIIQLCREHGISLHFVETPKHSSLYARSDYDNRMNEYFQQIADEDCDFILFTDVNADAQANVFQYAFDNQNTKNYIDMIHLSAEGRVRLTEVLVGKIQEIGKTSL